MAVSFGLLFIIFLIHGVLFGPVVLKIKFPFATTWRVVAFVSFARLRWGVWFAVDAFVPVYVLGEKKVNANGAGLRPPRVYHRSG